MAPIIRECKRRGHPFFVLHTGQHYSYEMDRAFFEDLELDDPEHNSTWARAATLSKRAGSWLGSRR